METQRPRVGEEYALARHELDVAVAWLGVKAGDLRTHVEVEEGLRERGNEIERLLYQAYLQQRSAEDRRVAEAHAAVTAADGSTQIAVIGVLVDQGTNDNPFLARLWPHLPARTGDSSCQTTVGLGDVIPFTTSNFARFDGSLTTPPCTEGVRWIEFTTPITASLAQIASFTAIYAGNARPVEPTNGRSVTIYNHF